MNLISNISKFLIVLFPVVAFCQEKVVSGSIIDKKTNAPIPYVNISILETKLGTSSDENGAYSLVIDESYLGKDVKFSSLGYADRIIGIKDLTTVAAVFLDPIFEKLPEVVLDSNRNNNLLVINDINKRMIKGGMTTSTNPHQAALFFPYKQDYELTPFLESVVFYFDKTKDERKNDAKFRIRVYQVNEVGLPGKDLLKSELITTTFAKDKSARIDLSAYQIKIPEDGLYVAFEWLHIAFNRYYEEFKYKKAGETIKKQVEFYSPRLGVTMEPIKKYKYAEYSEGYWKYMADLKNSELTGIPAISLTLSN